ncbi:hypothetical protein BG08_6990 (plasmid) [Bacillus thuringiensis serovar kurstaki]|nr:hypothetical protein BG08_6990 [Bacillus thuringiensis serovar kurstaki]
MASLPFYTHFINLAKPLRRLTTSQKVQTNG